MTAGAAAVGSVKLLPGVTVLFRDDAGRLVKPDGYHLEQGADAPLSEKTLANIAPYICHPADNLFYETTTRAEMEEFLDRKLHGQQAVCDCIIQHRRCDVPSES